MMLLDKNNRIDETNPKEKGWCVIKGGEKKQQPDLAVRWWF
jgi:hypothetical protein